jgi:hypothetical protein
MSKIAVSFNRPGSLPARIEVLEHQRRDANLHADNSVILPRADAAKANNV